MRDRLPVPTIGEVPTSAMGPIMVTTAGGITEAPDVVGFTDELVHEWRTKKPDGVQVNLTDDGVTVVLGWPGRGVGRVVYRVFGFAPAGLVYVAERIA